MRALITGIAGFIGSTLAEALLDDGATVRGIDCFTPYYPESIKRRNLAGLRAHEGVEVIEADLATVPLRDLFVGVDVVFHLAGQPGVRHSWAEGFADYARHNILATQRLLEAAKDADLTRLVYASSSSVYGDATRYPTSEADLPQPTSPYGVTKLAAEHLCGLYAANWAVPTVSLRYFTVYGPRQRPDMAMHRLIEAALRGEHFQRFGDGEQVREFTFVGDIVAATLAAATADLPGGEVLNLSGGASTTVNEVIDLVGDLVGRPVDVRALPAQAGDVRRTGGSAARASTMLGWEPRTSLREGLSRQVSYHRSLDPSL